MKYYCNPINVPYKYQFIMDSRSQGKLRIDREAADPSMICYQGKYYLFASMSLSVWVSEDMVSWTAHRLPDNLPLYDYAPDVRVIGGFVYFCASKMGEICNYYRTKDILNGPYEEIEGTFDFWDPNLFADDDGRLYFYWGCSNITPIWGVELDPETMLPKTERVVLIEGDPYAHGYERIGVDNCEFPHSDERVEQMFHDFLNDGSVPESRLSEADISKIKGKFTGRPYIEGAWVEKYNGMYYLQYACPGTEYNVYADGVYISRSPLGPFRPAKNNPFSYHPGGFMPGAGHGSTMWDREGNFWHASTMRIGISHHFERRVGIWPAGFDADGELFCNQNYGDWPIAVSGEKNDRWAEPRWYLLSYAKPVRASSWEAGKEPMLAVNEDSQTWWKAMSKESGQWLELDLEKVSDVRAIQINFADDALNIPVPGTIHGSSTQPRYIEERELFTRWKLEGSLDGTKYFVIEDKSQAVSDLPHDFILRENGVSIRYLRLTILEIPYEAIPAVSGLRVFGIGTNAAPQAPEYAAKRSEDGLDLLMEIDGREDAIGYNILWGHKANKLYHSYQLFRPTDDVQDQIQQKIRKRIGALVKDQEYYVRVDSFNDSGITHGEVKRL